MYVISEPFHISQRKKETAEKYKRKFNKIKKCEENLFFCSTNISKVHTKRENTKKKEGKSFSYFFGLYFLYSVLKT